MTIRENIKLQSLMVIIIFIFKSANKSVDKSILNGRGTYNIYKIKLYSKYKDISTSFNADYH